MFIQWKNLKFQIESDCVETFFFFFLGLHLRHMEVPQVRGRIRATAAGHSHSLAMQDLSHVCDLHWILNQLIKDRDQT